MKSQNIRNYFRKFVFTLLCLFFTGGTSFALDVYLVAKEFNTTMPDGRVVKMWGFAEDADGNLGTDGGELATVPGPMITVSPNDPVLNIHLRNDLGDAISIVIPGQIAALTPVKFTDGQGRQRVRSFTTETAAGQIGVYSWNNLRPGTYMYHSGSHVAVQVQMGLYGAVKKDFAVGMAYDGVPYNNEVVLLYSEIDPVLHDAIAGAPVNDPATPFDDTIPTYGTANGPTSTIDYKPQYFLINGAPYPDAVPVVDHHMMPFETVLIRFLNAGLQSHAADLVGPNMSVIAEDGNLYPFPKDQYLVLLPAGKTKDALITPSEGTYPIYDRMLSLTNGATPGGGMMVYLNVSVPVNTCQGDFDNDGDVDLTDLRTFVLDFRRTDCFDVGAPPCEGDFDNDGDVDLTDLRIIGAEFRRADCFVF